MPRRDGTGPIGQGSMTGRGLGFSHRRGFGRCLPGNQRTSKTQEEFLQEQKNLLRNRIEVIDRQLKNL